MSTYKLRSLVLRLYERWSGEKKSYFLMRLLQVAVEKIVSVQAALKKVKFSDRTTGGWRWKWFWRLDFLNEWYEWSTVQYYKNVIKPGMVIIDAGAHIGYFTRIFSCLTGPKGKVIAFEPCPENFELLRFNTASCPSQLVREEKALSKEPGTANLYLSKGNTMHSLLSDYAFNGKDMVQVECVPLDAYLSAQGIGSVDLIKVDAEGAEPQILQGMRSTLSRNPGLKIIMEMNSEALLKGGSDPEHFLEEMKGLGFLPFEIGGNGDIHPWVLSSNHERILCNVVFQKRDASPELVRAASPGGEEHGSE